MWLRSVRPVFIGFCELQASSTNGLVKPSKKGKGFLQLLAPHDHWHIDFSYINIAATFYYLCSALDGCSRFIVAWDIRLSMQEADAEIVLQRAREKFPQAKPRIISDQGSQFVARDFKEFIRLWQMVISTTECFDRLLRRLFRTSGGLKSEMAPKV
jgi:putative transposase